MAFKLQTPNDQSSNNQSSNNQSSNNQSSSVDKILDTAFNNRASGLAQESNNENFSSFNDEKNKVAARLSDLKQKLSTIETIIQNNISEYKSLGTFAALYTQYKQLVENYNFQNQLYNNLRNNFTVDDLRVISTALQRLINTAGDLYGSISQFISILQAFSVQSDSNSINNSSLPSSIVPTKNRRPCPFDSNNMSSDQSTILQPPAQPDQNIPYIDARGTSVVTVVAGEASADAIPENRSTVAVGEEGNNCQWTEIGQICEESDSRFSNVTTAAAILDNAPSITPDIQLNQNPLGRFDASRFSNAAELQTSSDLLASQNRDVAGSGVQLTNQSSSSRATQIASTSVRPDRQPPRNSAFNGIGRFYG